MNLRLDRLATLYLAWPLGKHAAGTKPFIPILMYHSISGEDESGLHAYYRTCTSPAAFANQMAWLHELGYSTCNLAQALDRLQPRDHPSSGTQAATKLAVITFDDGYTDFYRQAFPILNQHGFGATVYLPTAYIGDHPLQFKGRDCLTWTEVRELGEYGIVFGSHTVSHPQLRELSASAVKEEIVTSKKTIEERLGVPAESFAYPFAFPQSDAEFKIMLRDLLGSAGYKNGVCTTVGRGTSESDPFFMERLPVNSADDAALFQAKLAGAYDWIRTFQGLVKSVKMRAAKLW